MTLPADSPRPDRILFLFVDGLGLRDPAPDNPVNDTACPTLCRLIREHAVPLDACLGVPGLPQSATGQAVLFTGVNVPQALGKHVSGFPGPQIREFLERDNLFLALTRQGVRCKFANSYFSVAVSEIATRRLRSVTTVMALTVPETISTGDDLHAGRAVTEDLTRHGIRTRGYDGPQIEPEDAAEHLVALSEVHGFVLFEYFQSDRIGHSLDLARAEAVLATYDRFLRRLTDLVDGTKTLVVLTSDHGNVESMDLGTHTRNPVPLVAYGSGAAAFRKGLRDLTDVAPRVVATLCGGSRMLLHRETLSC
jgi:hypothetical protein